MKKAFLFILQLLIISFVFPQTSGPWTHKVCRAYSSDGTTFIRDSNFLFFPASVPDAVIDTNQNVYLYYVKMENAADTENLMVAVSPDGEYFYAPQQVSISGSTVIRKVDPCAVLLSDGRIRLFYIDFDMQPPQDVHSAISDDGIHYTEEPGIRYSDPNGITDPDVFNVGSLWNMYLSKGTQLIRTTSKDTLNFDLDSNFVWNEGAVCSTIQISCGLYKTYYCSNGIWSANSSDGSELVAENICSVPPMQNEIVCDPSIIRLNSGDFIMYFKSATITSVQDYSTFCCNQELQNYPNPFEDKTTIQLPETILPSEEVILEIYNYWGCLVSRKIYIASHQIEFDRTGLSNGIYSFIIISENGTLGNGKIIIE